MKRILLVVASAVLGLSINVASAQDNASSMGELLKLIEQGQARDSREARQREATFAQSKNKQQSLLNGAKAERSRQERESERLENLFKDNQARIITARAALDVRLGALKELFGVLQTVAGDTQGRFDASLTNIQFPDRGKFLVELGGKMANSSSLPSIQDIEHLWYELQREITETGKVVKFAHEITNKDGVRETTEIVRVGPFNVVADGRYLKYDSDTHNVSELQRQPEQGRFVKSTSNIFDSTAGQVRFGLDPTRGGILAQLVDVPNMRERVDQGGIVGYCIISLGLIGLLIALWRFAVLTMASRKVTAQLKAASANQNNPLGRVLAAYEANQNADTETIELKLSEAALKEMPGLTQGLLFIKIISVVAPLMGLLGTVTGMIKTFQVITLYGAGDPKLMAGGISQALVTTVLGLVVAIPMVLIHTVVSGQSRKIINVLHSQSAGIVAEHSERHG